MSINDLGENQLRAVFAAVQLFKLPIETVGPIARRCFRDLRGRCSSAIPDSQHGPEFWLSIFRNDLPPPPRLRLVPPPHPTAENDCGAP